MDRLFFEPSQVRTPQGLSALGLSHNPMTALVVPRPIGWISTRSLDGVANLAPFSFTNMVSQQPPMMMFCANALHAEGGEKDSLKNARETGEFVFNLATYALKDNMNESSATVARGVNEFDVAGLTEAPCRFVKAPRVMESPVALECRVVRIVSLLEDEMTGLPNTMTIGKIVGVHVHKSLIRDGLVDTQQARPLARLGYFDYGTCADIFVMGRPADPPAAQGAR